MQHTAVGTYTGSVVWTDGNRRYVVLDLSLIHIYKGVFGEKSSRMKQDHAQMTEKGYFMTDSLKNSNLC